jgi:hypothetical protein
VGAEDVGQHVLVGIREALGAGLVRDQGLEGVQLYGLTFLVLHNLHLDILAHEVSVEVVQVEDVQIELVDLGLQLLHVYVFLGRVDVVALVY